MANYINDDDLYFEIVLSKGKGHLTKRAEHYIQLIANNTIHKKRQDYKDDDEMMDCLQTGLLIMLENWKYFDERKFNKALPYMTEIFKRAIALGYNEINNIKPYHKDKISFVSMSGFNGGSGMHTI